MVLVRECSIVRKYKYIQLASRFINVEKCIDISIYLGIGVSRDEEPPGMVSEVRNQ